jgi:hypothetical protein
MTNAGKWAIYPTIRLREWKGCDAVPGRVSKRATKSTEVKGLNKTIGNAVGLKASEGQTDKGLVDLSDRC